MTVPDCMQEYTDLAEKVFGQPRHFSTLRFLIGNRAKYKTTKLENVLKNVTERRTERRISDVRKIMLQSGRGLCKTLV